MRTKAAFPSHKSTYEPNAKDGSAKRSARLSRNIRRPAYASWELDLKHNRFCWSIAPHGLVEAGLRHSQPSLQQFLEFIHPSDREPFIQGLAAARSGVPFAMDLRIGSKSLALLHVQGVPICDRYGEIVSVRGVCVSPRARNQDILFRQNDMLLSQAERIANFGTWRFDLQSRHGTVSPHLARMLGIEPGRGVSEDAYWNKVHPEDRARAVEIARSAVKANKPFEYVARYFPNGDRIRHHFVRGIPVSDGDGVVSSIYGITYDFSDQTHAESELQRLSQKLLRARDDERRNVARELHESTGQTLAALKMSLGRLREAMAEHDERLHKLLQSALELAEDAVREVRTLSYLMHPAMLDEAGLRSALHWYAKGFAERSGISVQVNVPEDFGRHGQEVETTIFRIVQEALTNIHRYSGSRTASISLVRQDDCVSAIIQDNGCGLPAPTWPHDRGTQAGVGIVGMRERVKQLNGNFEMESAPGKGTTVRIVLPIPCESSSRSN
jgi:signal transduction histidine kinase